MKTKTYKTSATIQLPLTEENWHNYNINGDINEVHWGKPTIKKRQHDYLITFDDKKTAWFVDKIYYHDLTKMRQEEKEKTEVK
jgi:hypothetical protein